LSEDKTVKQMLVVKVDKCVGCKSCELACAVEHSMSRELFQAIQETPPPRTRVQVGQGSGFAIPMQCRQCADAPCVSVCPTNALYRASEDGPVILDQDLCIGCTWCVVACPFGVITIDDGAKTVLKCDQCLERVERGELPACVTACPTGALEFTSGDRVAAEKREAFMVQIERSLSKGSV